MADAGRYLGLPARSERNFRFRGWKSVQPRHKKSAPPKHRGSAQDGRAERSAGQQTCNPAASRYIPAFGATVDHHFAERTSNRRCRYRIHPNSRFGPARSELAIARRSDLQDHFGKRPDFRSVGRGWSATNFGTLPELGSKGWSLAGPCCRRDIAGENRNMEKA